MNVFYNNTKTNVQLYIFILDLVLHLFTLISSPINVFFFTNSRFYKIVILYSLMIFQE